MLRGDVLLHSARVQELGGTERAAELAHARVAEHVPAQVGGAREALAAQLAIVAVAAAVQVLVHRQALRAREVLVARRALVEPARRRRLETDGHSRSANRHEATRNAAPARHCTTPIGQQAQELAHYYTTQTLHCNASR